MKYNTIERFGRTETDGNDCHFHSNERDVLKNKIFWQTYLRLRYFAATVWWIIKKQQQKKVEQDVEILLFLIVLKLTRKPNKQAEGISRKIKKLNLFPLIHSTCHQVIQKTRVFYRYNTPAATGFSTIIQKTRWREQSHPFDPKLPARTGHVLFEISKPFRISSVNFSDVEGRGLFFYTSHV